MSLPPKILDYVRDYELTEEELNSLVNLLAALGQAEIEKNPVVDTNNPVVDTLNLFQEWRETSEEDLHKARITIITMGEFDSMAPLMLSAFVEQVDFFQLIPKNDGCTILHNSIQLGQPSTKEEIHHPINDCSLVAFSVLNALKKTREIPNKRDIVIYLRPEENPELAETIIGSFNRPYLLFFESSVFSESILRLENGAAGCFVPNERISESWKLKHVVDADIGILNDIGIVLNEIKELTQKNLLAKNQVSDSRQYDHRVLLISYFASPALLVSTQRLKYWHDNLELLAENKGVDLEVVWLSATEKAGIGSRNIIVRDRGDHLVSTKTRSLLHQCSKADAPNLGISWSDYVKEEVKKWDDKYDTVIISVGPFGYMDLANFFKNLWGSKVIIDFRDPYAENPRMIFSTKQKNWIKNHELECVQGSDLILSVNQQCLDIIAPDVEIPRVVLRNGYDDTNVNTQKDIPEERRKTLTKKKGANSPIKFVYCGTIYRNASLDDFVEQLLPDKHELVHFGRDQTDSTIFKEAASTVRGGILTEQSELINELLSCQAGIIRLGIGDHMADTTKIFDYIGCDLDIIVVTDDQIEKGAVHELTQDLDRIFWVKNRPSSIRKFLDSYQPSKTKRKERGEFSRKHQTSILLDLIIGKDNASGIRNAE